jgi:DNA invertase Pin-like site-specific DNA recombinase
MIQDAHRRRFDAILVWKMDRLGRSLKHLVTTIEDLAAYGATFVSLRDNLDLSTPAGRLMMHVIGAMAEFERELIKERVNAGIAAARKRGVRFGRPKTYVSPDKIQAMRDAGTPWRKIAKTLKVGSTGTLARALRQVAS